MKKLLFSERQILRAVFSTALFISFTSLGQAQYHWTNYAGKPGGAGNVDGSGAAARFYSPSHVVPDSNGNLYVADSHNHVIRKISPAGVVSTFVGSPGIQGSADGIGTSAAFDYPAGLVIDADGNLYVADDFNHTIRKITPAGQVSTLTGKPNIAGSQDGTLAEATFNRPRNLALDSDHNLYVSELDNHTIRKISPEGMVTTLAGSPGNSGDTDGTGSEARFNQPAGLAVSITGDVFVADYLNGAIRQITPEGVVTTLTKAISRPVGIVISNGDLYVTDTYIHKVTQEGVVTPWLGYEVEVGFGIPRGIAVDASNNFYITDIRQEAVFKINPAKVVKLVAGSIPNAGAVNGKAKDARFSTIRSITIDEADNLYVQNGTQIRKITSAGQVSLFSAAQTAMGLSATIAAGKDGDVYFANSHGHVIGKVSPSGVATIIAGSLGNAGNLDATGSEARFNSPTGIAVAADGWVYVTDSGNNTIRKVSPSGVVSTFAGGSGEFFMPGELAIDQQNNLYLIERWAIRKITPEGTISILAGAFQQGIQDGIGNAARFDNPTGLTVDGSGNIFVCDALKSVIRKITPNGTVTTIGGTPGVNGGNDGYGPEAQFAYPWSVAVNSTGQLFVADFINNRISRGELREAPVILLSPADKEAEADSQITFTTMASGTGPLSYQWRKNGANIAKATSSTYTITQVKESHEGTYDVVVKNAFGIDLSTAAKLSVDDVVEIVSNPETQNAEAGQPITFSVTAPSATGFQWFKKGVAIKGATNSTFNIPSVSAGDAGAYTVVVTTADGKVTTPAAQLNFQDPGLLVYKITGSGVAFTGTSSIKGTISGFMVLDRLGQRGGFVWTAKNGTVKTHWMEVRENLHTQSTGPIPKSQTLITELEKNGSAPDEELHILWLRGTDALVKISKTDVTVAPQTLSGTVNSLEVFEEVRIEATSINLTLDAASSATSRLKGESLEECLERMVSVLSVKGSAFLD